MQYPVMKHKIKYISLIFISIVLMLFFLNSPKQIGTSIKTDGLKYSTYDGLILDEKEAYLMRNDCIDKSNENECEIKIFKSSKESGYRHWKEISVDIKSTIYSPRIFDNNDSFYMAVDLNDTYSLYKVSKSSEDIEKQVDFKKKIEYFCSDDTTNYIIVDNWNEKTAKRDKDGRYTFDQNETNSVYENISGEPNWVYKGKVNRHGWFTFDQDNNKYFLESVGPYARKTELRKKLSNDVITIKMTSISSQTVVIETNNYWFLGKDNNKHTLLKRYANGAWETVKIFSTSERVFPHYLHKYKNTIAVLTSGIDEKEIGWFLDSPDYKLYVSYDNGKNWEEYDLEHFSMYAYDFYKNKFMYYSYTKGIVFVDFDKLKADRREK